MTLRRPNLPSPNTNSALAAVAFFSRFLRIPSGSTRGRGAALVALALLVMPALAGQQAPSSRTYDSLVAPRPDAATPPGDRPIVVATGGGLVAFFGRETYASPDPGATWQPRSALDGAVVAAITVGGELRCLLRSGRVVRSTDGGATWATAFELAPAAGAEVLCGGFAPDGAAWASFAGPRPSVVAVVGDAVLTLDGARGKVGAGFRSADLFVAASGGEIYRGAASGEALRRVAALQGATLNDLAFADASLGWIATGEGNVLETHDGGTTWLPRPVAGASALDAVGLVGSAFWVVGRAGGDGVLYVSRDNGVRWRGAFTAPAPLSRPASTPKGVWVVDGAGGVWTADALDGSWRRVGALDGRKSPKTKRPKGR